MTRWVHLTDDETKQRTTASPEDATPSLVWAAASSPGRRRGNDDRWGSRATHRFAVADGVGSNRGGGLAGDTAIAGFLSIRIAAGWADAMRRLDRLVALRAQSRGIGQACTTIVGAIFDHDTVTVVHSGDSRAYLGRDDTWTCLTVDHNLGNERARRGKPLDDDDGRGPPHALTSYLGAEPALAEIGVYEFGPVAGDRLVLCTDGVHRQLGDDRMSEIVCIGDQSPGATAQSLVDESDAAGGRDNATALVIEVSP